MGEKKTINDRLTEDPESRSIAIATFATIIASSMLGRDLNNVEKRGISALADSWLNAKWTGDEAEEKEEKEDVDDGK